MLEMWTAAVWQLIRAETTNVLDVVQATRK